MYGLHFDHHTLSIARDGELLATEPLAVETATSDPRFGRAALAAARGRPDEVSLVALARALEQRQRGAQRRARSACASARAVGHRAHRSRGCRTRRSRCGALDGPARRAERRGRGYARLPRCRHAHRRGGDRSQPLRAARCGLAFRHGDARGRRRRMHLRRSLRERARQPARRLRSVAHRRGRRAGEEHALRSAAQSRCRTAPVRRPAAARRACRHRRQGGSRGRIRRRALRGARRCAAVRRCRAAVLSRTRAPDAQCAHRRAGCGAGVAGRVAALAGLPAAAARARTGRPRHRARRHRRGRGIAAGRRSRRRAATCDAALRASPSTACPRASSTSRRPAPPPRARCRSRTSSSAGIPCASPRWAW